MGEQRLSKRLEPLNRRKSRGAVAVLRVPHAAAFDFCYETVELSFSRLPTPVDLCRAARRKYGNLGIRVKLSTGKA